MSETGNIPTFNSEDIPVNASENDVPYGPQTEIIDIADKLDYVNPAIFTPYQMESEQRLAVIRRGWLENADRLYREESYNAAISQLQLVIQDIEISGDTTHLEALNTIIDHCWEQIDQRIAKSALRKTVETPDLEQPLAS